MIFHAFLPYTRSSLCFMLSFLTPDQTGRNIVVNWQLYHKSCRQRNKYRLCWTDLPIEKLSISLRRKHVLEKYVNNCASFYSVINALSPSLVLPIFSYIETFLVILPGILDVEAIILGCSSELFLFEIPFPKSSRTKIWIAINLWGQLLTIIFCQSSAETSLHPSIG